MLTRSLDQLIFAAHSLPDHIAVAERAYGHSPQAQAAFAGLRLALAQMDEALLGPAARPPAPVDRRL